MIGVPKIGCAGKPASLLAVGFSAGKAKHVNVWQRTIRVTSTESVPGMTPSLIQQWEKEGKRMEQRIGRSKVEGKTAIATIRPHGEYRVSATMGELIAGTDEAWNQSAAEYHPMMEMIAKSLSPGL